MGRKSKKKNQRGAGDQNAILHRCLERGDYKLGLKLARVLYAQFKTPEHRRLLECASMGRAQDLLRMGDLDRARVVARGLLELGPTELSVQEALPTVLASLGMLDKLASGVSDARRAELELVAADHAVIHGHDDGLAPSVCAEVTLIRTALVEVERGADTAALKLIDGIRRDSPLADWRLFVRGLTGYYARDEDRMTGNWERLSATRAAVRIARPLLALANNTPDESLDGATRSACGILRRQVETNLAVEQIDDLSRLIMNHDWSEGLRQAQRVRRSLERMDRQLFRPIADWLFWRLVDDGEIDHVSRLLDLIGPQPLDPFGNRLRALVYENTDYYRDEELAVEFWQQFLLDMDGARELSPADRDAVKSLTLRRIASIYTGLIEAASDGEESPEQVERFMVRTVAALEASIALTPARPEAYHALASFYARIDQPSERAAVYRRLLRRVPDDVDGLMLLALHHQQEGEPIKALQYVTEARRVRPLDTNIIGVAVGAELRAAQREIRSESFERARAAIARACELRPDVASQPETLATRALLELRAGDEARAFEVANEAIDRLAEPTAFWLIMSVLGDDVGLPATVSDLYRLRWLGALKKRCRSSTAGEMCRFARRRSTLHTLPESYVDHLKKYVARCGRVKWTQKDLEAVCMFVMQIESYKLMMSYAKRGQKLFPDSVVFHCVRAAAELALQNRAGIARARAAATRALELARESNDHESIKLAAEVLRLSDFMHSPISAFKATP